MISPIAQTTASRWYIWRWLIVFTVLVGGAFFAHESPAWAGPFSALRHQSVPPPPSRLISDDFNSCQFTPGTWTFVDPVGDAAFSLEGERAQIAVPAGVDHDIWTTGNRAPRLMQQADDASFAIEVKFDSPLTARFQSQGILIEQDSTNFIRAGFQSNGAETSILVATFRDGVPIVQIDRVIADGAPLYLRVLHLKQNDYWEITYSHDGVSWADDSELGFNHLLRVTSAGVFAGNAGREPPAHTALIDYFFNQASPINPEDPIGRKISIHAVGGGTVVRSPMCGSPMQLTALPNPGWNFAGWQGDLSGLINPQSIVVTGREVVTATFTPDPYTLNISVSGGGTLQLTPEQEYYAQGDSVTLTAIPNSGWTFAEWSGDLTGPDPQQQLTVLRSITATARFVPLAAGGVTSDDFNACALDRARWTFVNPAGDAELSITGESVAIALPAGTTHDLWQGDYRAPRLMQPAADVDMGLEVKFDTPVSEAFQIQGIVVEQDAGNFVRVSVQSNGADTKILAATVMSDTARIRVNEVIPQGAPVYLQVTRAGNGWAIAYSQDGLTWSTGSAFQFSHALTVSAVGVFAGNAARTGQEPPAHTAIIDYFFNMAAPIHPEDPRPNSLPIEIVGQGRVDKSPVCGSPVTLTALPKPGWAFQGWSGALIGTNLQETMVIEPGQVITATFTEIRPPTTLVSDDFNACHLDEMRWTIVNPRGDASFRLINREQLAITVPGGVSHDIWEDGNFAPRVVQKVNDTDFAIEARFDSPLRGWIEMQGVLIEEDADDLLRVNFQSAGQQVKLVVISLDEGAATVIHNDVISEATATLLRIGRVDDLWTVQHSADGSAWTTGVAFTHALTVTQAGVFAGNASSTPPNHTAMIDYVFNPATPISPEDGTQNTLIGRAVGGGSVDFTPSKEIYDCGEPVTITATSNPGWRFKTWSGDLTGATNPATIDVNRAQTVTATFVAEQYALNLTIVGQGDIEVDPLRTDYVYGDVITLTVKPVKDWPFLGWGGDLTGNKLRKRVTIKGDMTVTATFVAEDTPTYSLAIETIGEGAVTVSPTRPRYGAGEEVTLTAVPDADWRFSGWRGALSGIRPTATLMIVADTVVTATFTPNGSFVLTVSADGGGRVTRDRLGPYTEGDTVTLTATPDAGWSFVGWSQDVPLAQGSKIVETAPRMTVQMTADLVYIANFRQDEAVSSQAIYLPLIRR